MIHDMFMTVHRRNVARSTANTFVITLWWTSHHSVSAVSKAAFSWSYSKWPCQDLIGQFLQAECSSWCPMRATKAVVNVLSKEWTLLCTAHMLSTLTVWPLIHIKSYVLLFMRHPVVCMWMHCRVGWQVSGRWQWGSDKEEEADVTAADSVSDGCIVVSTHDDQVVVGRPEPDGGRAASTQWGWWDGWGQSWRGC